MEFLIGCRNVEAEATEPRILEEEYQDQFVFSDLGTKVSRTSLILSAQYNIVTNEDIIFHVEVEISTSSLYIFIITVIFLPTGLPS